MDTVSIHAVEAETNLSEESQIGNVDTDLKDAVKILDEEISSLEHLIQLQQRQHSLLMKARIQLLNGTRKVKPQKFHGRVEEEYRESKEGSDKSEARCDDFFVGEKIFARKRDKIYIHSELITHSKRILFKNSSIISEDKMKKLKLDDEVHLIFLVDREGTTEILDLDGNVLITVDADTDSALFASKRLSKDGMLISIVTLEGRIIVHNLVFKLAGFNSITQISSGVITGIELKSSSVILMPNAVTHNIHGNVDKQQCDLDPIAHNSSVLGGLHFTMAFFNYKKYGDVFILPNFTSDTDEIIFLNTSGVVKRIPFGGRTCDRSRLFAYKWPNIALIYDNRIYIHDMWPIDSTEKDSGPLCICELREHSLAATTTVSFDVFSNSKLFIGYSDGTVVMAVYHANRKKSNLQPCCKISTLKLPRGGIEKRSGINNLISIGGHLMFADSTHLSVFSVTGSNFIEVQDVCFKHLPGNINVMSLPQVNLLPKDKRVIPLLVSTDHNLIVYDLNLPHTGSEVTDLGWLQWILLFLSASAIFVYQLCCKRSTAVMKTKAGKNLKPKESEMNPQMLKDLKSSISTLERRIDTLNSSKNF